MRTPFRLQASAFLLAMVMPLAQGVAAEESNEASVASLKQDVQNLSQELSAFTAERRDQLMTDIEKVLASLDDRIATLEDRLQDDWDDTDKVVRAQAQTALASLHRERARVMEWYQRMQDSADFTWESMKDGFNDAFGKLSEAWRDAEQNVDQVGESI